MPRAGRVPVAESARSQAGPAASDPLDGSQGTSTVVTFVHHSPCTRAEEYPRASAPRVFGASIGTFSAVFERARNVRVASAVIRKCRAIAGSLFIALGMSSRTDHAPSVEHSWNGSARSPTLYRAAIPE